MIEKPEMRPEYLKPAVKYSWTEEDLVGPGGVAWASTGSSIWGLNMQERNGSKNSPILNV